MRFKYIAFDVDGTLVDALTVAVRTLGEVLQESTGMTFSDDQLYKIMGLTNEDAFRSLGIDVSDDLIERWVQRQAECSSQITLFDGVKETLNELKRRGHVLGIVTSRSRGEYEADRRLFDDIEPFIDHIVLAEMTREHKPSPQPLLKFIELCGARPEETLYVGDTVWDMDCAASAGASGCAALWGALDKEIKAPFCASSPKELLYAVS